MKNLRALAIFWIAFLFVFFLGFALHVHGADYKLTCPEKNVVVFSQEFDVGAPINVRKGQVTDLIRALPHTMEQLKKAHEKQNFSFDANACPPADMEIKGQGMRRDGSPVFGFALIPTGEFDNSDSEMWMDLEEYYDDLIKRKAKNKGI